MVRDGMLNLLGKVRLGKAELSCNNKYCHNLVTFALGHFKYSFATLIQMVVRK